MMKPGFLSSGARKTYLYAKSWKVLGGRGANQPTIHLLRGVALFLASRHKKATVFRLW